MTTGRINQIADCSTQSREKMKTKSSLLQIPSEMFTWIISFLLLIETSSDSLCTD